jgi:hydrogenase nickel incorporation protein HypB
VITGDQHTDNDARRLAGRGTPVAQIETRSACHLNAEQVLGKLESVAGAGTGLLFIENVGNLVCPAAFDLGERHKVALLSVTEGEDKPLKYPGIFRDAPVCVITKIDLIPHLDFDLELCRESVFAVRPDARIIELSARTGQGMEEWLDYLEALAAGRAR